MRILITGTRSGLGRHIHETFGGIPWTRQFQAEERTQIKQQGVDIIIHCAFNSNRIIDSSNLFSYVQDNVLLTEELVSIQHNQFIFISSVDVYPCRSEFHSEDEVIDAHEVKGIYGITKLMSEAIVKQSSPNHLILRCASLLGRHARKNSLMRILQDSPCELSLASDSTLNFVLHSDVSDFLLLAIKRQIQGIYNVASTSNVVLSEIVDMLGKRVKFGDHVYHVGDIDTGKILSVFPRMMKTSQEVVAEFIGQRALARERCS